MGILNGGGVMAGIGVALAVTVPLIYPLTNHFSVVFYIWSIPLLIATVLWWLLAPEPPRAGIAAKPVKTAPLKLTQLFKNKIIWLLAVCYFSITLFLYFWSGWDSYFLLKRAPSPVLPD
jgi:CP family cyanate transporter-like MFS transporter